jgi:hypothetical protein
MHQKRLPVDRLHAALGECQTFEAAVLTGVRQLPVDSLRSQIASLFIATALDHYRSMTHLFSEERYDFATSAFALIRPVIDSAFRGVWIANFATDEDVATSLTPTGYRTLEKKAKPDKMYDLMKVRFNIQYQGVGETFKEDWKAVHGFVHTGPQQLKNRLKAAKLKKFPYEPAIAALLMGSFYIRVGAVYIALSTQNTDVALSIALAHDNLSDHVEVKRT